MHQPVNFESDICGRVPLNQTNMIQPHGMLLIADRQKGTIIQGSENLKELFGRPVREVVGTLLEDCLDREQLQKLESRFVHGLAGKIPLTLRFRTAEGERTYLAQVKAEAGFLLFEIEGAARRPEAEDSFLKIYEELKYAMAAIETAPGTTETCHIALRELKRISGFDRLMVYQFDEDWNGTVIAEVAEEGMDPYFGLKFPASDIPRQARELYRTSPFRLIPNVDYEPVRLYPVLNPVTNAFTDLSDSNLRSVAAVHIEYLRNMGVTASMSTRILKDDRLWGLIACHHRSPKYLSFEQRAVFELLSSVISAKITAVLNHDAFRLRSSRNALHTRLVEEVYREEDLSLSFDREQEAVRELLGADGLALVVNGRVEVFGQTPEPADVQDLVAWLRSQNVQKLFHHSRLSAIFEPAEVYAGTASGLLALPVLPDRGTFVLAFRPEAMRKVDWGGNPAEAVQFGADGKQYHPRRSFRTWQETVRRTAFPWKEEELEVAETFRNFLVAFALNKIYG